MSEAPAKRREAVALAYQEGAHAPHVVAKGRGILAETIIRRAHEHGVFVHESRELVSLLMQVNLDQRIPPELYRAVAEVLAFVYWLENKTLIGPPPSLSLAEALKLPAATVEDVADEE